VVTDFGLARRGGDPRITTSGALVGTPTYMPPEQIGSPAEAVGPACDVYSLGVILYELLAGRPPFLGNYGEVLRQVLAADPPPLSRFRPGLDPRLEAVCLRAMAKDPTGRFASMAALAAALADPPATRGGWRWWAAAAAAAVVLAVVGWAAWPPADRGTPADPGSPAAPAASTAGDELPAGSRWVGEFRFAGHPGPAKPVMLTVTERAGERFRAQYQTEGVFLWAVDGTVRDGAVRWDLTTALNKEAEGTGATGKAFVAGRLAGGELRVTFHDPGDGSRAEMVLARRE
jgi:hypothetical protein